MRIRLSATGTYLNGERVNNPSPEHTVEFIKYMLGMPSTFKA